MERLRCWGERSTPLVLVRRAKRQSCLGRQTVGRERTLGVDGFCYEARQEGQSDYSPYARRMLLYAELVMKQVLPEFLTVDEVAELLRVSPRSVYDLVSQGVIPHRKAGRRTIFLLQEILEWTINRDGNDGTHKVA